MKTRIITALVVLSIIFLGGCVTTTTNGKHYGQITAVEDSGLIWQTTTVYFKTDVSSSQEDTYCLDKTRNNHNELLMLLEGYAKKKQQVTILFHDELITAPWRCGSEYAIIDGVRE